MTKVLNFHRERAVTPSSRKPILRFYEEDTRSDFEVQLNIHWSLGNPVTSAVKKVSVDGTRLITRLPSFGTPAEVMSDPVRTRIRTLASRKAEEGGDASTLVQERAFGAVSPRTRNVHRTQRTRRAIQ